MSSKSRGGLSKREYAAKQAGVKVNYSKSAKDQGKSVSTKSSSSSKSSGSSSKSSGGSSKSGSWVTVANPEYGKTAAQGLPGRSFPVDTKISSQKTMKVWQPASETEYRSEMKKKDKEYSTGYSKPKLTTSGNIGVGNNTPSFNSSSQRDMAAAAQDRQQQREPSLLQKALGALGIQQSPYQKGSIERTAEILKDPLGLVPWARGMWSGMPGEKVYDSDQAQALVNGLLGIPTASANTSQPIDYSNGGLTDNSFYPFVSGDAMAESAGISPEEASGYISNERDLRNQVRMSDELKNQLIAMGENPQDLEYNLNQGINPYGQVLGTNNYDNQLAFGGNELGSVNQGGYSDLGNEQQMGNDYEKMFKEQQKNLDKSKKGDLSALDTLINQASTEGQTSLNEAKGQDLGKLASLFAAYGTSDSEQRMQQEQRTNNDYAGKLATLLSQLATQRTTGTNDINSSYNTAKNSIAQQRMNAQMQVQQMMQQAAQQSFENKLKMAQYNKANQPSLYQMASTLKNKGTNWGDIASQLGNAGYDLTPGNANSASLDAIMTGMAPQQPSKIVNLGNGYVMDQTTGDVYQAY